MSARLAIPIAFLPFLVPQHRMLFEGVMFFRDQQIQDPIICPTFFVLNHRSDVCYGKGAQYCLSVVTCKYII